MSCWNFFENFNLEFLDIKATQLIERLEFLGHNASFQLMQLYQKWLRCFKGDSQADPMALVSEFLESLKSLMVPTVERENQSRYLWAHFNSLTLSYNFGLFDLAYKYSNCCRKMYEEHNFGARLSGIILFYECLVFFAVHHNNLPVWRRRYSMSRIKLLRHWSRYAYKNLLGKLFLVEAEYAVAIEDHHAAPSLYFSAILHFRQSGFIALEAMANERAGKYYFSRSDVDHASEHFQEAIRLYSEWGAFSKVNHLQAETNQLLGNSSEQHT
jgi:tetratricopeptide (TPR) repeat protein